MYLLDTDVASNLLHPSRHSESINDRIRSTPIDEICIAVVTAEEMLRGALDEVRRAQSRRRDIVEAYSFFQRLHYDLHRFAVLPYSVEADRL